ncbi:MAG: CerR family C-terminal domain-containing protein [Methylococcaceae bacterium]
MGNFPEPILTWLRSTTLIAHEIADPTNALDDMMETAIVPQITQLKDITQQILKYPVDKVVVPRCLLSILGQCLMFKHSRSIIDRLYPDLIADAAAIQASVEHITQLSLAALNRLTLPKEQTTHESYSLKNADGRYR